MRILRLLSLCVLSLVIPGCTEPLIIPGPTPVGEGIMLFIHADFAGASQALNVNVENLDRIEGPCTDGGEGEEPTWGDCVSSIRVLPGWRVTLYRDSDFRGQSVTLTADTPNLRMLPGPCDGSFNDCVSSIRVSKQ